MSQLDWPLTPERSALADALIAMCEGTDDQLMSALEEAGIGWIGIAEAEGGSGGDDADLAVALRLLAGRARNTDLAESGFISGWALQKCGHVELQSKLAPAFDIGSELAAARADGAWQITGRALNVPIAENTHLAVLPVLIDQLWHIALVAMSQAEIIAGSNLAGESRAELLLDNAEVALLLPLPSEVGWIDLHARLALARAVQISGALLALRDLTVNYARTREQFGKPIAEQQAVAHMLAAIAEQTLLAEAAVATAINSPTVWNCAIAKSVASRAARRASADAHQVHGAMGMSQEYPLGSLTTRLWSWIEEGGRPEEWETWLGTQFMRQDQPQLWEAIVNAGEGQDR
ncbi:MAG: acyl-CoA dehydrogenase family protein [Actinomycetota bacterium]|nr:acyl-CoA dehydrogenase family protein [Actinomycetota bacterium]